LKAIFEEIFFHRIISTDGRGRPNYLDTEMADIYRGSRTKQVKDTLPAKLVLT